MQRMVGEGALLERAAKETRGRSRSPPVFVEDHPNLCYHPYLPHCRWLIMHLAHAHRPPQCCKALVHAAWPLAKLSSSADWRCSSARLTHNVIVIIVNKWQTRKSTEQILSPGPDSFLSIFFSGCAEIIGRDASDVGLWFFNPPVSCMIRSFQSRLWWMNQENTVLEHTVTIKLIGILPFGILHAHFIFIADFCALTFEDTTKRATQNG